ncbi:hypothetical protein [Streptomyces clavuligerus]|nr:hypothetical protein [Streptomyces clavuligerus]AXU16856.1 hypothetical protein D1794_29270 [Streptomyces clavuligerus]MBY6300989.1 hypothetical protein [Streptomyces clavuligerus]QPJ97000.1 hypothetical protein GE265_28205 [Streptomyces clavuligerus]
MNKFARIAATSIALLGAVQMASPAAAAPAAPVEAFHVCYKNSDCNMGYSVGSIDWRWDGIVPKINGSVVNRANSDYSTTVYFEAYYIDQKVDTDSRTVADGVRNFDLTFNVALISRIKITVCQNFSTGQQCGSPENYSYG